MRKKRLVVLPGRMDNIFFINELPYLTKSFDHITVFAYSEKKEKLKQIPSNSKVEYSMIKNFTLYSVLHALIILLTDVEISKEIHNRVWGIRSKKRKLEMFAYLFLYVNFAINAEREYKRHLDHNYQDTLYSFWLSRGAFAISYIKKIHNVYRVISRAHRYDLYEERNRINYLPFRQYIYKYLDEIAFISRDGLNYFKNKYDKQNKKLLVSYLGTSNIENIRKYYSVKDHICIASCSNIIPVKRLDVIIDLLSSIDLPIRWIHIGDGSLRKTMEAYAEERLKHNYRFMGKLDNSQILSCYFQEDVDFFINMSDSEGIPVSMMEALSFGIPIIGRNVGGTSEIVNDENGILLDLDDNNIEADDKVIVYKFLKQRLDDMDTYIAICQKARVSWENNFFSERNYTEFVRSHLKADSK